MIFLCYVHAVKGSSFLIFLSLFFVFSCGNRELPTTNALLDSSVIIGKINWKNLHNETKAPAGVLRMKNSIGRLSLHEKGLYCSAFLISKNMVMTNYHCLPHTEGLQGIEIVFNFEEGQKWEDSVFICEDLVVENSKLDYAILKCQGSPGDKYPIIKLSKDDSEVRTLRKVLVIHHNCDFINKPNCIAHKKLSSGRILWVNSYEIAHNADTLSGSSGSPLISVKDLRVIGIHNSGDGDENGRGRRNYAAPMLPILKDLEENYPLINLKLGPNNVSSPGY